MNKNLKVLSTSLFLIAFNVLLIFGVYYYFYRDLETNKELFPENKLFQEIKTNNLQELPQNEMTPGKDDIPKEILEKYGILSEEVKKLDRKVYFIDGRELEEFEVEHIKDSEHIRTLDITKEKIKKVFYLSENEFNNSFFVIYCHDGTRSGDVVGRLGLDNLKFLIGGVRCIYDFETEKGEKEQVFEDYIINHEFTISSEDFLKLKKNNDILLLDVRLYENFDIPGEYDFRIGKLSTGEYNNRMSYILENQDKKIVCIADIYPDLFYSKLLFQRLIEENGFNKKNLYILFGPDKNSFK